MGYHLKPYQKLQARKLNVIIQPSNKKLYKLDVFTRDGDYITSIGDKRYSDYASYIEEEGIDLANRRRELYHKRHRKDDVEGTRGFYSLRILW